MYALYHGDQFIDLGTLDELAIKLNVKKDTIMFYKTPSHLKRTNYNGYIVIKIEEIEND